MAIGFLIWIPLRKCLSIAVKDCKDNFVTKRLRKGARSQLILLRFLTEGAIELGLASMITAVQMSEQNFEDFWEGFSTCFAYFIMLFGILVPLALTLLRSRLKRDMINEVEKSNYKDLYDGLRAKDTMALLYSVLFFFRRILALVLIMNLSKADFIQFQGHILLGIAQYGFVAWVKPFEIEARNRQEIVNELGGVISLYHLMYFTGYLTDLVLEVHISYSLLVTLVVIVNWNIIVVATVAVFDCKLWCRKRWYKKACTQVQKERLAYWEQRQIIEGQSQDSSNSASNRSDLSVQVPGNELIINELPVPDNLQRSNRWPGMGRNTHKRPAIVKNVLKESQGHTDKNTGIVTALSMNALTNNNSMSSLVCLDQKHLPKKSKEPPASTLLFE